jgi:hypothetical protein
LETFGQERLESSGIAQRQEDGRWTLAPALTPGGFLVAFREESDAPIFEILTPRGGLVGQELPIMAAQRDHRFLEWMSKTGGRLLGCASMDQIPPFLTLALPAITLHGLTDLNFGVFRSELEYLGWRVL